MTNIFKHTQFLGALNKNTGDYICPRLANKKDKYICPDCKKDLILCQGEIRAHHFRHVADNKQPCNYYNSPTESQIHKDAKLLIKQLLEQKIPIKIVRNCSSCKGSEMYEIPELTESSSINLEFGFDYNGLKIADVAYIDNKDIVCIFEIYKTHRTAPEKRPEPWFEINATNLILQGNDPSNPALTCIRKSKCEDCLSKYKRIQNRLRLIHYTYKMRNEPGYIYFSNNYIGNIKRYPKIVSKYTYKYIRDAESIIDNIPFKNTYVLAIKRMQNYGSATAYKSDCWNKASVPYFKDIVTWARKHKLINPITLFRELLNYVETVQCKKCIDLPCCYCDLSDKEISSLEKNSCLICKDTGNMYRGTLACWCQKFLDKQ